MCGFYELLSGSMNYKLYIFDIRKSISLILFFCICLWYGIYIIYIYVCVCEWHTFHSIMWRKWKTLVKCNGYDYGIMSTGRWAPVWKNPCSLFGVSRGDVGNGTRTDDPGGVVSTTVNTLRCSNPLKGVSPTNSVSVSIPLLFTVVEYIR